MNFMKLYVILPEVDIGENSDIASPLPLPFLELLVFWVGHPVVSH